ncbi:MAG: cytochrome ubiquinol oxidase subunit I [Rhodopseudomonas palustris]|nr:cytochrome ubiquinol oxidase subunit I [Rhodopseudomonas palustris]
MVAIGTLMSAFWILSANSAGCRRPPALPSMTRRPVRYADRLVGRSIFNPSFPYRLRAHGAGGLSDHGAGGRRGRRLSPAARSATAPDRAVMFSMAMWMVAAGRAAADHCRRLPTA